MNEPLIIEYLGWLKTCRRSPRTIDARAVILRRMDEELTHGLVRSTAEEIKAWIYRDGWSLNTISTYYGAAASFFVYACGPACSDPLDFNPMNVLPRPEVPRGLPRPVTDQQLQRILAEAREPYRTWAKLAAYEGLRCIEISRLDREHVNEVELRVFGKGDKPAVLPTHPLVWAALQDLPAGPVAVTPAGDRATATYVSVFTAMYFARNLRMPGVSLHKLRHWYGTAIYRKTKDLRRTQELLRHSSPNTTQVYTLITNEERAAAIRALPTFTGA